MPLRLLPGEAVLWTNTAGPNVASWRDTGDSYVTVTSHRLILTHIDIADRSTEYLPLEKIDSVVQLSARKDFTKKWLITIIIGLLACVIPGVIIFLIWFFARENTLLFTAGGGRLLMYNERLGRGGGARQEELINVVESARRALLRQPPPSDPVRVTLSP